MAPRANWKGFLRLSLVTCPVALYPGDLGIREGQLQPDQPQDRAPHQIRQGRCRHRRRSVYRRHRQGLQGRHRHYLEVTKDELENIALESTHTIEIDEFVPRSEIDTDIRPPVLPRAGRQGRS